MLGWLARWWGKRRRRPVVVDFYTRHGCHLCEDALALLRAAGRRYPLEVRVVDVDSDPALIADYGLCVPVVAVNGRVRFRGRVNGVLLERLLRAEARAERPRS